MKIMAPTSISAARRVFVGLAISQAKSAAEKIAADSDSRPM